MIWITFYIRCPGGAGDDSVIMVAVTLAVALPMPFPMATMAAAMPATVSGLPATGIPTTTAATTATPVASAAVPIAAVASLRSPTPVIPTRRRRRCRRLRLPDRIATPVHHLGQGGQLEVHPQVFTGHNHERLDDLIALLLPQPGVHAGPAALVRGSAAGVDRGAGKLPDEPELDLTSNDRPPQSVLHLHHQRLGHGRAFGGRLSVTRHDGQRRRGRIARQGEITAAAGSREEGESDD